MFQDDWIMRQINDMVRFITVVMNKKETSQFDEVESQKNAGARDLLQEKLNELVNEKKIAEAEKLLLDSLDTKDKHYLNLAVDFYAGLNRMDDKTLEEGGFSRTSVQKGLTGIASRFGIPLASLFIDLPMG